jgi:2'-5' RNA ligase
MCDMPGGNAPEIRQALSHRSAVVLIPDDAVWEPIQRIRRSHDRQIRRWMPHVTLLYPFFEGFARETSLDSLSRACVDASPFEVSLSGLSRFRHRSSNTIWLKPEPADALRNLHKKLCSASPGCVHVWAHADGFTPHLSVGQVQGEEACDSLLAILQNEWTPLTFRADRISVIARDDPPEDIFKVLYEIELGTGEMIEIDDGGQGTSAYE